MNSSSPDVFSSLSQPQYDPSVQGVPGQSDSSGIDPKAYLTSFFYANSVTKTTQSMIQSYMEQVQQESELQKEYVTEDDLKEDILKAVRKLEDSSEKRRLLEVLSPSSETGYPYSSTESLERMG